VKPSVLRTISIYCQMRKSLIARATVRLAPYDAFVMPTTAITPPRIADLADDQAFTKANLLSLRNCTLINMIDGCAISLPCHREGDVAGRVDARRILMAALSVPAVDESVDPWLDVAETKAALAGRASVNVRPLAVSGP